MRRLLALIVFLTMPAAQAYAARAVAPGAEGIAWHAGNVDAAFAQAKRERKPVFLFWGAVWCPPCNQVKATIFNRQDFIERSRAFVPVYLDGDTPAAQKLGSRFKVSGYPTMILFRPDGTEVTRLPGEVDGDRYMEVLTLGINATRPVRELLAAVNSGKHSLGASDWRLLAFYAWDVDEQSVVPKAQLPATLVKVAQACPPSAGDAALRLQLKALAVNAKAPEKDRAALDKAAALAQLQRVLADEKLVREMYSVLTDSADDITGYLTSSGSAERTQLLSTWDKVLIHFADETSLSRADRLGATAARVALAKLDQPKDAALPTALAADARTAAARADKETTNVYERQAVITFAGYVLREAGLLNESDTLLKAELTRSHSPYYYMSGLASNAKRRGDAPAALDWYAKAYDASKGPATRLQWGTSYVRALIELAPQDAARIEQAAGRIIGELEAKPETFYARNGNVLSGLARRLNEWGATNLQDASLARLRAQMDGVCNKLPAAAPERKTCAQVLAPKAAAG